MKILTQKQARKLVDTFTGGITALLKAHGMKPKERLIAQYRYKLAIALNIEKKKGGKHGRS